MRRSLAIAVALAALAALAFAPIAGAQSRVPGIDVSRFQGQINWDSVARDDVEFAFAQASRGSGRDCSVVPDECGPDQFWEFNYLEAKREGIRVGPYHRAFVGGNGPRKVRRDAKIEARVFIEAVGELKRGDLRPALDLETPFASLSPFELRVWTRTWLKKVRRALGAKPIIYTNNSSWEELGDPTSFARKGHALWVANWNVSQPIVPADDWAGESWRIWQHTSSGRVRGISGRVDLNWLRGGWPGVSLR